MLRYRFQWMQLRFRSRATLQQAPVYVWAVHAAMLLLLSFLGGSVSAVTVSERELAEGIDPIPSASLYAGDVHGPLVIAVPTDLCLQDVPPTPGLPVAHPLADRNAPGYQLRAATAGKQFQVRYLQRIYCRPVFDEKYANALRSVLPAACFQPPERAGLVNPAHMLADRNRFDVLVAEQAYLAAVTRIKALRERCVEAALEY
jgi:hypothetical protein